VEEKCFEDFLLKIMKMNEGKQT